jgi:hypothetical protein
MAQLRLLADRSPMSLPMIHANDADPKSSVARQPASCRAASFWVEDKSTNQKRESGMNASPRRKPKGRNFV